MTGYSYLSTLVLVRAQGVFWPLVSRDLYCWSSHYLDVECLHLHHSIQRFCQMRDCTDLGLGKEAARHVCSHGRQ